MKWTRKANYTGAAALFALALAGCGGSGSGDGSGGNGGGNGGGTSPTLSCSSGLTAITAVQGTGTSSPMVGDTVSVRGVIHAEFLGSDRLNGFFIQVPANQFENNAEASQGLFVRAPDVESVRIGDVVAIRGRVSEDGGLTQLVDIEKRNCGTRSAITFSDLRFPIEDTEYLERYEGMAIRVVNPMFIADHYNLARFGELLLSSERLTYPTELVAPGAEAQAMLSDYPRYTIILDDGSYVQNPEVVIYPPPELLSINAPRINDQILALQGVLSEGFGSYRIHPIEMPLFTSLNPRTASPDLPEDGDLTVASVNLWDYFPEQEQFFRQRGKLVELFRRIDADVYALQELGNDGFGPESAVADLVDTLNASVVGTPFEYVVFGDGPLGEANITNGIIYRSDRVQEIGAATSLVSGSFAFRTHRPPVAQSFEHIESGERFTLIGNHIRSRRCDGTAERFLDQNDGQGCASIARREAAEELVAWLSTDPTGIADAPYIIAGDFNSYRLEEPAQLIEAAGFTNAYALTERETYTYVFQGMRGAIDHIFIASSLSDAVTGVDSWRVNADEPRAIGWEIEHKSSRQQIVWYSQDQYRSSDHNPVIVRFDTSLF